MTCRHSLLDAKITSVLSLCHDQVILSAVQSIIQNMIACEDSSQQQLHYLQSKYVIDINMVQELHYLNFINTCVWVKVEHLNNWITINSVLGEINQDYENFH